METILEILKVISLSWVIYHFSTLGQELKLKANFWVIWRIVTHNWTILSFMIGLIITSDIFLTSITTLIVHTIEFIYGNYKK